MNKERCICIKEEETKVKATIYQEGCPSKTILLPRKGSFKHNALGAIRTLMNNYGYSVGEVVQLQTGEYGMISAKFKLRDGDCFYAIEPVDDSEESTDIYDYLYKDTDILCSTGTGRQTMQ